MHARVAEVIIVDEIATRDEAAACRTIAARGVLLVSTAHGNSLSDLLVNPDLSSLVGGVKPVTLGDKTAAASNRGHKTRLERGGAVTFGALLEIVDTNRWRLHPDVAASVDVLLSHSHSTGGRTTQDLELAQNAPPGFETQLRTRAGAQQGNKMMVCFESGRVPASASWVDNSGKQVVQGAWRQPCGGQYRQWQYKQGAAKAAGQQHRHQKQQRQHTGRKRGRAPCGSFYQNQGNAGCVEQQQQQQ